MAAPIAPITSRSPSRAAQEDRSGPLPRRASVGEVLAGYVAEQVAAIEELEPAVRGDEPDAVHQLRVAIRRLRSALTTFRPVLDRERTRQLAGELKWLAGVLGRPRDLEVLQARVEARLAGTDSDLVLGPVPVQLTERFARDHAEARAACLEALDDPRYPALLAALRALRADPPVTGGAEKRAARFLPGAVGKAFRGLRAAVAAVERTADGVERDLALHEARKKAKRARYAVEAAVPVVGREARRLGKRLKSLQELLGEHQDSVVARQFLRELAASGNRAGINSFTYGIWYTQEQQAARDVENSLPTVWAETSRRRYHRWATAS